MIHGEERRSAMRELLTAPQLGNITPHSTTVKGMFRGLVKTCQYHEFSISEFGDSAESFPLRLKKSVSRSS